MKRLFLLSAFLLAWSSIFSAETTQSRFENLGHKMMCTCGDCQYALLECNHVGCQSSSQMIRELRTRLDEGSSDDKILDWFRQTYGPTVVLSPKTHGFELTAWIAPFAALGFGLLLAIAVIRNWRPRTAPVAAADSHLDPQLETLRERARKETDL
jgi:cytochrome c-type biogenesis protein CcmH/NrfF